MSRIDELIHELCPDGVAGRPLGSLGTRNKGTAMTASKMKTIGGGGPIRVFAGGQTVADVAEEAIPAKDVVRVPSIIVKSRGHIGFSYYERPFTHKTELWSYSIDAPGVDQKFVYYYLLTQVEKLQILARATSVKLPQLSVRDTDTLSIPVPPLEVQREIVRVLDKFTQLEAELEAELEARRVQYEYYRAQILDKVGEGATSVPLGDLGRIVTGRTPRSSDVSAWGVEVDFVTPSDIRDGMKTVTTPGRRLSGAGAALLAKVVIPAGSLLVTCIGADMGKTVVNANDCVTNQQINSIIPTKDVVVGYLFHLLTAMRDRLRTQGERSGGTMPLINKTDFSKIEVPIPSLEAQKQVASNLDEFNTLVNDISIGLPAELAARRMQYEHYRDRLLTFKELAS